MRSRKLRIHLATFLRQGGWQFPAFPLLNFLRIFFPFRAVKMIVFRECRGGMHVIGAEVEGKA